MTDQVDDTVRRVHKYLYEDGLIEIGVGILFIVVGLGLIAFVAIQDNTIMGVTLIAGLLALAFGGALFTKRALEVVKERMTYPRTGYVSYRSGETNRGRWLAPVAAILLLILSLFLPEELTRISSMIGALMFVIICSLGYRLRLRRFYAIGSIALLAGASASLLFLEEALGAGVTFSITGLALLVSGAFTLSTYLRRHPMVDEVKQ
ncbi:MAG: hypothetical protein WA996_14930 [Candidatus Promineifilaceae bacterium]